MHLQLDYETNTSTQNPIPESNLFVTLWLWLPEQVGTGVVIKETSDETNASTPRQPPSKHTTSLLSCGYQRRLCLGDCSPTLISKLFSQANKKTIMSHIKIYIHVVMVTHKRKSLLSMENKDLLCNHILSNCKQKNIHLLNINGWQDHLHGLISLGANESIGEVMNLIKGEASYWANRNLSLNEKFSWGNEYYAASVSYYDLHEVNDYIKNQEDHHSSSLKKIRIGKPFSIDGWQD